MALGQKEIGERVRQARDKAGLTQHELAERIGLRQAQSVSRYERGETAVPPRKLRKISEATGVTLEFLLVEDKPPVTRNDPGTLAEAAVLLAEAARELQDAAAALRKAREVEQPQRKAPAP